MTIRADVQRAVDLLRAVQRACGRDWQTERERTLDLVRLPAIETRVPSKWLFVDLETGDVWEPQYDEVLSWRSVRS